MTGPRLVVHDLTHTVGHGRAALTVLHAVSLQVAAGEIVALAGRSGSGKTTLCHVVAGTSEPQEGTVEIDGTPAHRVDEWATRAFLPQRLGIAEELSVAENAFLPARLRGREEDPELLDRLALRAVARRPAAQTSLGEQQRTGLARALCLAPALLVLDEPTGHQDDDNVVRVLAELRSPALAATAQLIATHDPRVIATADRVVRLAGGRVLE